MPARRPYASRGVPRRATTRRSGNAGSSAGIAALVAVLVIVAVGIVWLADPFAAGTQGAARSLFGATRDQATGPATAVGSSVLQMAEVAAPDANTTSAGAGATPTSIPTLRRWDASAAGVIADARLVRRLDQALAGIDGHISVAVKDLGSGRGAVLDGDRELPAASLYKLPILFAVFEAGLSMGEELPITEEAREYDSGTLELGVGETLAVAEALERMVTISDNTAAVMLGGRAGSGRINADIAALGMDSTHYSLERMTTSASDMLRFLDLLARGRMVSTAASSDMVHLLLRQRVNDRLPRLLPGGVEVAHKTGNLPGTVNDVGIIYGPTSTLAVAALVSDTTDEAAAASGIAQLSLAAYTYFAEQPEEAGRPTIPRAPARQIPPVWREPRPVPTVTPTVLADELPTPAAAVERTPAPALSQPRAAPTTTAVPAVSATTHPTAYPARTPAVTPVVPATATPVKR
jgi:beta-lactamase class A